MNRRQWMAGSVACMLGGLATGVPPGWLRWPAAMAQATGRRPTTLLLSLSRSGDPVNAAAPGSDDPDAVYADDDAFAPTSVRFGETTATAGAIWGTLPAGLRHRMAVVHHRTLAQAHGEYDRVLGLSGAVTGFEGRGAEMLPSAIAQELAGSMGTVQMAPVCLSRERLMFAGRRLPTVAPHRIQALFAQIEPDLDDLAPLRDARLDAVYGALRKTGTSAQRRFLDEFARSRAEARTLGVAVGDLLSELSAVAEGSVEAEVIAATALAAMRASPVVTFTVPFGGDNHADPGLVEEAAGHGVGMAAMSDLWNRIVALELTEEVTFGLLNVFGRRLGRPDGRNHHPDHNVLLVAGPHVRGGVVGSVDASGRAKDIGSVAAVDTLPAAGATLAAAVGVSEEGLAARLPGVAPLSEALV